MTSRQLQQQAYSEWSGSGDIRRRYHTFEYYWWERYARVYRLLPATRPTGTVSH